MSNTNDFVIENGVLTKYTGPGGDVVIPAGVTEIDWGAFSGCTGLTSITIPDSVTSIGDGAFKGCTSLTSVVIPDSVTEIDGCAFSGCVGLTEITIPDSVAEIGEEAFDGCSSLKNVSLPAAEVKIGFNVFANCSSLESVTIPEGGTVIPVPDQFLGWGWRLFENCGSLAVIRNESGSVLDERAIKQTEVIVISPKIAIDQYKTKAPAAFGFLTEPSSFSDGIAEGYKSYAVRQAKTVLPFVFKNDLAGALKIFAESGKITAKNLEEDYLKPAQGAGAKECVAFLLDWSNAHISREEKEKEFDRQLAKDPYNATDMKKLWRYEKTADGGIVLTKYKGADPDISIPERIGKTPVTMIGPSAFSQCMSLTSVVIPDSVTGIGDSAFYCCKSLKSVTIPSSVTKIGKGAFDGCTGLTSITIPDSVTSIGSFAFSVCAGLTEITIPDSVTSIGNSAFYGCEGLTQVTIPDSVTEIGWGAFFGCTSLTSITIPDSVTKIGGSAFNGCTVLTSISVPAGVTEIGKDAFFRCTKLTLRAPAGSYAEEHAKTNNIPFEAI